MDQETIDRKIKALEGFLALMDVPEMRRNVHATANLRWLSRNLGVRNGQDPMFPTTMELIVWLLKHQQ